VEGGEEAEGTKPSLDPDKAAAMRRLLRSYAERTAATTPREITELPPESRLHRQDLAQDIELKKRYAYWLLGAMLLQLMIANGVFVVYAWVGRDWDLSPAVINIWLGATLAEVVGIVLVVTRYLFPRRDVPPK
jgi:hypothetical protein